MNCEVFGQPPQYRYHGGTWERRGAPNTPWRRDWRLEGLNEAAGYDLLEASGVEYRNINPTDR